jgi:glycine/D-amino acid oxidase-like deaminating enzyme
MAQATDVLVVGGGLIGCGLAWRLRRRGSSVILVEAGDINAGASGQNAGSLHFQLEHRFLERDDASIQQAAPIVALSRLAVEDWRALEAELGADLEVKMNGGLMVAETTEQIALLEKKQAREAEFGLKTRLLDGDEARRIAPYLSGSILAAGHLPDEGHASPRAIAPALARAAAAEGADIMTHTRVVSAAKAARGFHVGIQVSGGPLEVIQASCVVLAAGIGTGRLAEQFNLHLPLFAAPLTLTATERAAPFMPHLIQHVARRLSMKQTSSGNVLIGGGWPSRFAQRADGGLNLQARPILDPDALIANLTIAAEVAPTVANLSVIRTWTGATTVTSDQLPLVGPVSQTPGVYVATGGSGFTLGPTFSRLLADLICGDQEAARALAIVSPDRFGHLNSFMG